MSFGIDIGGSGIKGAPVDLDRGVLAMERVRFPTPEPSKPEAVADTVVEVLDAFDYDGPVGCTFPAVVKGGVTKTAANVDKRWIGYDARLLFEERTRRSFIIMNDADAAGMAEMSFGAGRGQKGVVIVATLGTGIGTAVFTDGHLLPNTELGHLEIDGKDAERRASDKARKDHDLTWEKWAQRLTEYFDHLSALLQPDLIVVGGGVSKKHDRFLHLLDVDCPIVPAELLNNAGMIGAALVAQQRAHE